MARLIGFHDRTPRCLTVLALQVASQRILNHTLYFPPLGLRLVFQRDLKVSVNLGGKFLFCLAHIKLQYHEITSYFMNFQKICFRSFIVIILRPQGLQQLVKTTPAVAIKVLAADDFLPK